jgi:hypothetical protein
VLRLAVPVLRDFLAGQEELDTCVARDFLETLEGRTDRPGLAVRHDRDASNRTS